MYGKLIAFPIEIIKFFTSGLYIESNISARWPMQPMIQVLATLTLAYTFMDLSELNTINSLYNATIY